MINSIEKYVHKTEEDSFAENFDIVNENNEIAVSPKGSSVEKLTLGNGYNTLGVINEDFNASIDISKDEKCIELHVDTDNKYTDFLLTNKTIKYEFSENGVVADILFDKNGISVTTNSLDATNANKVLKFVDTTNSLEVTFTVAELIALKALLPTT